MTREEVEQVCKGFYDLELVEEDDNSFLIYEIDGPERRFFKADPLRVVVRYYLDLERKNQRRFGRFDMRREFRDLLGIK